MTSSSVLEVVEKSQDTTGSIAASLPTLIQTRLPFWVAFLLRDTISHPFSVLTYLYPNMPSPDTCYYTVWMQPLPMHLALPGLFMSPATLPSTLTFPRLDFLRGSTLRGGCLDASYKLLLKPLSPLAVSGNLSIGKSYPSFISQLKPSLSSDTDLNFSTPNLVIMLCLDVHSLLSQSVSQQLLCMQGERRVPRPVSSLSSHNSASEER